MYENETEFPTFENNFKQPTLIYPNTKYCAERFAQSFCDTYGMNVTCMRFANVYGPHIDCLRSPDSPEMCSCAWFHTLHKQHSPYQGLIRKRASATEKSGASESPQDYRAYFQNYPDAAAKQQKAVCLCADQ